MAPTTRRGSSRSSGGETKTLYHGAFTKLGPVLVTVKSDVLESKFKGKSPYVTLEIDGQEHYYQTENGECEQFWDGHKGETFAVQAVGSREEAGFEYLGEELPADVGQNSRSDDRRPPAQTQERRPAPPRQQAERPPQSRPPAKPGLSHEQALTRAKVLAMKVSTLEAICYLATENLAAQWLARYGQAMGADQFQSTCSKMFIEILKHGFHVEDLPVKFDFANAGREVKPKEQEPPKAKAAGKQREEHKEPEPEPTPAEQQTPLPPEDDDVPF